MLFNTKTGKGGEMGMNNHKTIMNRYITIMICFVMAASFTVSSTMAQSAAQKAAKGKRACPQQGGER